MIYVGYAASLLVLLTFCMKGMIPLRVVALCSNVAFIAYACGMQLMPIILLHGVLIPINIYRLASAIRERRQSHAEALPHGVSAERVPSRQ